MDDEVESGERGGRREEGGEKRENRGRVHEKSPFSIEATYKPELCWQQS